MMLCVHNVPGKCNVEILLSYDAQLCKQTYFRKQFSHVEYMYVHALYVSQLQIRAFMTTVH